MSVGGKNELGTNRWEDTGRVQVDGKKQAGYKSGWVQVDEKKQAGYKSMRRHGLGTGPREAMAWVQVGGKKRAGYKSIETKMLGTSRWENMGWVRVGLKTRAGYKSVGRHGLGTSRWGRHGLGTSLWEERYKSVGYKSVEGHGRVQVDGKKGTSRLDTSRWEDTG